MRNTLAVVCFLALVAHAFAAEDAAPTDAGDAAVRPPKGFHSVTPYLYVKDAKGAMRFYAKAFSAKPLMVLAGENGLIDHAELQIGDGTVMLADIRPDAPGRLPQASGPFAVHLYVHDVDAVYQRAIDAGAREVAKPADMPWGHRFAMVTDPYGHAWSIATPKTEDRDPPAVETKEDGFK